MGFRKLAVELFFLSYKYREMKSLLEKEQHSYGIVKAAVPMLIHPHVIPLRRTLFIVSDTKIWKDVQPALSIL